MSAAEFKALPQEEKDRLFNLVCEKVKELQLEAVQVEYASFDSAVRFEQYFAIEGEVPQTEREKLEDLKQYLATLNLEWCCRACLLYNAGDMAPRVDVVDVATGETVPLFGGSRDGKVLFIDFWATWCGPCQGPMQHNQEILLKKKEQWKDKATIVAVSVNDDKEEVKVWLTENESTELDHVWADGGWNSACARSYGIQGVPTCWLVDKEGKLVKKGHPSEFDIEQMIDDLLASDGLFDASKVIIDTESEEEEDDHHHSHGETAAVVSDKPKWQDLDPSVRQTVMAEARALMETPVLKMNAQLSETFKKRFTMKDGQTATRNVRIDGRVPVDQQDAIREVVQKLMNVASDIASRAGYIVKPSAPTVGQTCSLCNSALAEEAVKYVCAMCMEGGTVCAACFGQVETTSHKEHAFFKLGNPSQKLDDTLRFGPGNLSIHQHGTGCHHEEARDSQGRVIHHGVFCDGCRGPMVGVRYKCANCSDTDFCETCESTNVHLNAESHDPKHVLFIVPSNLQIDNIKPITFSA